MKDGTEEVFISDPHLDSSFITLLFLRLQIWPQSAEETCHMCNQVTYTGNTRVITIVTSSRIL